jgi:transposase
VSRQVPVPVIAGRILAEAGDVARFPTKDAFASYNGTAPIDASSGERIRHRLSPPGTGGSTTHCTRWRSPRSAARHPRPRLSDHGWAS